MFGKKADTVDLDKQVRDRLAEMVPAESYSTSSVAAWQIVERMIADGWEFELRYGRCWEQVTTLKFTANFHKPHASGWTPQWAATMPEAICLAFLNAGM